LKKQEVYGNINGLKKSIIEQLQNIYSMDSDNSDYCSSEVLNLIANLTYSINREIAIFINNRGKILSVFVGDFKTVEINEKIERGSRCIHTHPGGSGKLSSVDINTLKTLPIISMAAIGVKNGAISDFYCSYINKENNVVNIGPYNKISSTSEILNELKEFATTKRELNSTEQERVIAVGVNTKNCNANLDELEQLIITAGGVCVHKLEQNRENFDNSSYVGKGKIQELMYLISSYNADTICFDDPLNNNQMRNLKQSLNAKILDRSSLILDIFAKRANSKEGKLQVELAQLNHLLPLLSGQGVALSRLGGGIGTRGPGETKLESDRRHILRRVNYLKKQLKEVEKRRTNVRENRKKQDVFIIAIVGYTNAGKSTLINKITNSEVFVKDMLFATLDTSIRSYQISASETVLFVDTVGFISKLPHELIEAFKSTLEEVVQANLILHVMDGSSDKMEEQAKVVYEILEQINASKIKVIEVINKVDIMQSIKNIDEKKVYVSAKTGNGIPLLLKKIEKHTKTKKIFNVSIPYENGKLISYIHDNCEIITEEFEETKVVFKIKAIEKTIKNIKKFI